MRIVTELICQEFGKRRSEFLYYLPTAIACHFLPIPSIRLAGYIFHRVRSARSMPVLVTLISRSLCLQHYYCPEGSIQQIPNALCHITHDPARSFFWPSQEQSHLANRTPSAAWIPVTRRKKRK